MDETIVDLFYFITIGVPPRNMSINTKLATATNKAIKVLFNMKEDKQTIFSVDDLDRLLEHIQMLSGLYQEIVIKYFTDKKQLLDLSEECREMRKELYEKGSIEEIELLYPSNSSSSTSFSIYSINGEGNGSIISIGENNKIAVISAGGSYKLSDVVIGYVENNVYIFKVTKLNNIELNVDTVPITWNMPLHTQIYRFFFPNSFDAAEVRATKNMIESEGLDYVIKLYITKSMGIDQNLFNIKSYL